MHFSLFTTQRLFRGQADSLRVDWLLQLEYASSSRQSISTQQKKKHKNANTVLFSGQIYLVRLCAKQCSEIDIKENRYKGHTRLRVSNRWRHNVGSVMLLFWSVSGFLFALSFFLRWALPFAVPGYKQKVSRAVSESSFTRERDYLHHSCGSILLCYEKRTLAVFCCVKTVVRKQNHNPTLAKRANASLVPLVTITLAS